jgi:acyl-CoA synthetase (AMP-forming)/AMP-acid ligase II
MLCTFLAGGTLVVQKHFEAAAFLDIIRRERITHTAVVPVQLQRLVEHLQAGSEEVANLRAMMCCGSPLHASLMQEVFRRFPCGVIELYGLTEGVITTLDPEDAGGRQASVGKPLLGTDLRIIDDSGRALPAGACGEIVKRGRIPRSPKSR